MFPDFSELRSPSSQLTVDDCLRMGCLGVLLDGSLQNDTKYGLDEWIDG